MYGTTSQAIAQAELDCRAFARQYPTPNVARAIELAESGRIAWVDVAAVFARSLAAGLEAVR